MYTLINGSPKINSSNSSYFLKYISKDFDEYKIFELKNTKYNEILKNINKGEIIVFGFPLYVDSPPSLMLEFLDYILDNKIKLNNKLVYVIINCGFRDGTQNITAVDIIKRWCNKVNATYASSMLIGAGEIVGKNKYRLISNRAFKNLNNFSKIIKDKKQHSDIITTVDFLNDTIYCKLANISWTNHGKKYKLSKDDLKSI